MGDAIAEHHGLYATEVTELGKRLGAQTTEIDVASLEAEMGEIATNSFVEYSQVKKDVYGVLVGQPGDQSGKLEIFNKLILPTKKPVD